MLSVSYSKPPKLWVQWNHIDGPLLHRRDGTLKWLTYRERLMHWLGLWTLQDLERRPSLTSGLF